MQKLQDKHILLLGHGYTGKALATALRADNRITTVSRQSTASTPEHHILDLSTNGASHSLPDLAAFDHIVVSVPPQKIAPAMWEELLRQATRVVLFGSTGVYARTPGMRTTITESSPVLPDNPRIPLESSLLACGGSVLRLAGIYGPGRNPRDWLARGKVLNEPRQVNLIHLRDIVEVVQHYLAIPQAPACLNLADGQPHTWREIVTFLRQTDSLPCEPTYTDKLRKPDSFVACTTLVRTLPGFRPLDFWMELDALCHGATNDHHSTAPNKSGTLKQAEPK